MKERKEKKERARVFKCSGFRAREPHLGQCKSMFELIHRAFWGGDLNPGERHSRVTRDDGTVTLCALRTATVLSRNCCADFGRLLTKKVMSRSRDGPGFMHHCGQTLYLSRRCGIPSLPVPPLEKVPECKRHFRDFPSRLRDHTPCCHHISSGVLLWLECESISCLRLFRAELHIEVQQRLKRYTAVRQLLDLWACTSSIKQKTKGPKACTKPLHRPRSFIL